MTEELKCPDCLGTGDLGGNPSYGPCERCGGKGRLQSVAGQRAAPTQPAEELKQEPVAELIERLGWYREHPVTGKLVLINPDGPEAAASLSQLVKERDEARAEAAVWANSSLEKVGQLRTELDEANEKLARAIMRLPSGYGEGERGQGLLEAISGLRRRAEAAERERDALREALRPFAEASDCIEDTEADRIEMWEHPASMQVTAGDFRRARSALNLNGGQNV